MRAIFLAFVLLSSTAATAADAAKPAGRKLPADAETCQTCHTKDGGAPVVDFDRFAASWHNQNDQMQVGCTDCHAGYKEGPHEGELSALSPADQAVVAKLSAASFGEEGKKEKITAPRAFLACASCHDAEATAFGKSVHGKWLREDTKTAGATCASCHGSPHAVTKLAAYAPKPGVREPIPADRRELAKRCEGCHGNEELAKAAGLNPEVKGSYHDSMHGRLVRVGNAFAPSCANCHAAAAAQ